MTRSDRVRRSALRRPRATALDDGRSALSYRELDRRVDRAAARLRGLTGRGGRARHRAGDRSQPAPRLALVLGSRPGAVILFHAAPRAGLVPAPLSPRLTGAELAEAFDALDPVAVICDRRTAGPVARAAPDARVLSLDDGAGSDPASFRELPPAGGPDPPPPAGDVRAVVWTSGTSGRPRGVLLTDGALEASARASRSRLGLRPGDRWLASLSLAHVGGIALATRAASLGSTLVVRDGFDAAELVRLAGRGAVTHASLVPVMLRRVLDAAAPDAAPGGLRCLLVGGDRAPEDLVEEAVARGCPVALTYGMTETSSQVATADPARVRRKPGSVGPPLPGVRIRIADDGEIRVRGDMLAGGYLGSGELERDEGGWLRTGDLGRLDDEGDLRVTGRRSERIVSGGVTVDPEEVEGVLRGVAGIREAAVVGLADAEWGERVAAALVRSGEEAPGSDRLERHLRDRLSGPKRPRRIRFVDRLPRTRTGKVDREAVRALLAGGDGPPSS